MDRAVFLDRDGVINPNVYNPATEKWESPHDAKDFRLYPWVLDALKKLKPHFSLFLISNQPSYAKGKTSLKKIEEIQLKFQDMLERNQIFFKEHFYCYHHPDGLVPEYSGPCQCRKPSPYFLEKAHQEYMLDMKNSWIVGDRATDIQCGKAAGVKTIFIHNKGEKTDNIEVKESDYMTSNLAEAVKIILSN